MSLPKESTKIKEYLQKLSEAHKGKVAWNKGTKGVMKSNRTSFTKDASTGENNLFYGKNHTEKAKEKNRLAHLGKRNSPKTEFKKGLIPWNKDMIYSQIRGKNHPNWKDGITSLTKKIRDSFQYRQWRSDVFTRDDFTCQECGRRGGCLHAHHKEAFADIMEFNDIRTYEQAMDCEELWNINNGITLCDKCHYLTRKNNIYKEVFDGKQSSRL